MRTKGRWQEPEIGLRRWCYRKRLLEHAVDVANQQIVAESKHVLFVRKLYRSGSNCFILIG